VETYNFAQKKCGNLQLRTEKMWKPRTNHRNLIVIKYCQLLTETYDLLGATSWKPTITHRNLQLLIVIANLQLSTVITDITYY